ncbi:ATP-grasp fold amidoligase family protein [Alterinioella nitratireducens]|uniref:ATP-grasp fold amidoligase family protein n=1 Tax=Rhodobacterales TaxID=204455 RepID=UPI004058A2E9
MKAFDKPDSESPFLNFVRKEYNFGRGSEFRRELANKEVVGDLISPLGISIPKKLRFMEDINDLRNIDLPERFVLKYARGWASRGVMLLTYAGGGKYFCLLSQRVMDVAGLIETQIQIANSFKNENLWLIEEMVESPVNGKPIPLDYKFYCFRGEVGLIAQIDRNSSPPKIALMNGDFTPLRHKTDYVLKTANAQMGIPAVPLHANDLLAWARILSRFTDSPFVSIDLYDGIPGPSFGEFTFSPGGTHKRMWVYGHEFLQKLDQLFVKAEKDLLEGNSPALPGLKAYEGSHVSPEAYAYLAASVLGGSVRAADRLREYAEANASAAPNLVTAWTEIRDLIKTRHQNSVDDRNRFLKKFGT